MNPSKNNILLFIAFCFLTESACRKKDDLGNIDCSTVSAKYSTDIQPLVAINCIKSGCHDAGSPRGDYTTYDGIKAKADNGTLYEKVVEKQTMPKGGTLTVDERTQFKCWIDAGALNN